jgi:hypothetical protein
MLKEIITDDSPLQIAYWRKIEPPSGDRYSIIPKWPDNSGIVTSWTVAVQALCDLPREGTKDGTTLPASWQGYVESINSPEAFRVLKIQGLFWVNVPNLWPRVQNIGIMGQSVKVLDIADGWAKVKTYKLSDSPHDDADCIHDVFMINRADMLAPIRNFPVKIILISDNGYLYVPMSRLKKLP